MQLISTFYFILICYLYVLNSKPLLLNITEPGFLKYDFSMLSSPMRLSSDWRHRLPWVFYTASSLLSSSTQSRRRKRLKGVFRIKQNKACCSIRNASLCVKTLHVRPSQVFKTWKVCISHVSRLTTVRKHLRIKTIVARRKPLLMES